MTQSSPLNPGSTVWTYLRVSGDEQAKRITPIASQRKAIEDYCRDNDLVLAREFSDEARPGDTTTRRDDFNRMISEARRDPPDAILLWSWARFARDQTDAHYFKADLRRQGIEVISITDPIPAGEFAYVFESLIHWKDERRRQEISDGVKRTFRLLAERGYIPGGFPPRGYKIQRETIELDGKPREVKRWVPDPEWWDQARRAWEMKAQGADHLQIIEATGLYKTRHCLSTFFRNSAYRGETSYGGIPIPVARMIDDETWNTVQSIMDEQGRLRKKRQAGQWHPRRVNSSYLLSGLLYCGHCGAAMVGDYVPEQHRADGHRQRWDGYVCGRKKREGWSACPSGRIKASLIDTLVLDYVCQEILIPQNLAAQVDEIQAEILATEGDATLEIQQIEQQLTRLDQAIARLMDAIEQRGYGEAIESRLRERERERRELGGRLSQLRYKEKLLDIIFSDEEIVEHLGQMRETLEEADPPKQRAALSSFIKRIEVHQEVMMIYYVPP